MKREFVDRIAIAEPDHLYDTLVQFGNAPITGIVNMLWNNKALATYDAATKDSGVRYEDLVNEYTRKRDCREKRSSAPNKKILGVAWKKPLCARKKTLKPAAERERQTQRLHADTTDSNITEQGGVNDLVLYNKNR